MTGQQENLDVYRDLHRGFLVLQRRMRSLRSQLDFPLDSISAIVLLWIGYKPVLHFGELQRTLHIPKANLSRLMQSLVERGYVESSVTESDTRKKQFQYTTKGAKLLAQLDTINNRLVRLGTYPLSREQIASATAAVAAIATGLGAPPDAGHPGEEPLFTQIRRLLRVSGMIGSDYLGCGHEIMLYHVFSELGRKAQPIPLKFFLKALQIPPSSLSRDISKLVTKGWIEKVYSRSDRKQLLLRLTEKGVKHYEQCETLMAEKYRGALQGIPLETIQEWITALAPLEGLEPPMIDEAPIVAERCESDMALHAARTFVVQELVRAGQSAPAPDAIIPADQECIAVREAGCLMAIAFAPKEQRGAEAIFSSVVLSHEVSTEKFARAIVAKASELLRGSPLSAKVEKSVSGHPFLPKLTFGRSDSRKGSAKSVAKRSQERPGHSA